MEDIGEFVEVFFLSLNPNPIKPFCFFVTLHNNDDDDDDDDDDVDDVDDDDDDDNDGDDDNDDDDVEVTAGCWTTLCTNFTRFVQ
jgi:hypothetical protein